MSYLKTTKSMVAKKRVKDVRNGLSNIRIERAHTAHARTRLITTSASFPSCATPLRSFRSPSPTPLAHGAAPETLVAAARVRPLEVADLGRIRPPETAGSPSASYSSICRRTPSAPPPSTTSPSTRSSLRYWYPLNPAAPPRIPSGLCRIRPACRACRSKVLLQPLT
jgi:hypothetical protein